MHTQTITNCKRLMYFCGETDPTSVRVTGHIWGGSSRKGNINTCGVITVGALHIYWKLHQLQLSVGNGFNGSLIIARNKRLVKDPTGLPILQSICHPKNDATAWASIGIPAWVDVTCVTAQETINTKKFSFICIITKLAIIRQYSQKELYITCAICLILHQSFLKR